MQRAFTTCRPAACSTVVVPRNIVCQATPQRRAVLLSGAGVALSAITLTPEAQAGSKMLPVSMLSTFQRKDQKAEILARANTELEKCITREDGPKTMRLVFNDAATYDIVSKTGGMDGSVVLNSEEAKREENAGLDELVGRLKTAKAAIDAESEVTGAGPISWADLLCLAARTATRDEWLYIKKNRAAVSGGGETISKAFGAEWDVRLGRVDSTEAAPAGRIPGPNASVDEIRLFMLQLAQKPGDAGPFAPKPPFWERPSFVVYPATTDSPADTEEKFAAQNATYADFKKKYTQSRRTVTRTDYEVDFITYFTRLTGLGATFDPDAYLYPVKTVKLQ